MNPNIYLTSSPPVSLADGCLLACWQVYDKVFAIFNQVPALHQYQVQLRTGMFTKTEQGEKEQVLDKSLVEIVLFDNNNMSSVCPLSAVSPYLWVPALTSGQSHIIANQLTSQLTQLIISPRSLFCLTDYCKVFRIAKCSQQCLISESRPSKRKVTLALQSSPNSPDS